MVKEIIREISKMVMFTVIWALPIFLAVRFSQWYLLLMILSCVITSGLFTHFEELEKIDRFSDIEIEEYFNE